MELQLREYRIAPGRMDDWIAGWRSGVVPLRKAAGFQVLGAWVDDDAGRFVWLLGYDGSDGFSTADARYYNSPGRSALDPDPAALITSSEEAMVRSVSDQVV